MNCIITRAKRSALAAVCPPNRLSTMLRNDFSGIVTRSMARAILILKPKSHVKKNDRPARIIARRQTTGNANLIRRTQRRAKSTGDVCNAYYCVCNGPDTGTLMIMCDNKGCRIKWYHVACLAEEIDFDLPWQCNFCNWCTLNFNSLIEQIFKIDK